jgi:hypothetical protein
MDTQKDERSLGELFSELTRQMSALVRQEMNLAKTEMTQKAREAGKDTGYLVAGGAVAYAGFLMLLVALMLLLGIWLPLWVAALIVGVIVAGVGAFLVQRGRERLAKMDLAPQQTVDTLKETTQWAREQTS